MNNWIPVPKIQIFTNFESYAICAFLLIISFFFYFFFLKNISEKRHGNLKRRFILTCSFLTTSFLFISLHYLLVWKNISTPLAFKVANYLALISLILGAIGVIRLAQIYVYLYLFFTNSQAGVPRLIGNMFTFFFSTFIFCFLASSVFDFNIATIATTSAVFSLVLGFALQDTLGNFFSGLALQIDRPFHINDWVEIHNGPDKWIGQIQEINWRATFLLSFSDELIMVPNKTVSQSLILILTHPHKPVRLNQAFRFPLDVSIEKAKAALLKGLVGFSEIMKDPEPLALVTETTDSWITIKVFYSLTDYGKRYRTGDAIIAKVIESIKAHDLKLAHQTFHVKDS